MDYTNDKEKKIKKVKKDSFKKRKKAKNILSQIHKIDDLTFEDLEKLYEVS